ncbi:hypothetical protein K440DRAFT_667657 [Wilcoxina mikolae CBS 423.85]|nr:hypothetical protein K440DRAFT_667657 [Wilcoxina mikolae CBS 423.85]
MPSSLIRAPGTRAIWRGTGGPGKARLDYLVSPSLPPSTRRRLRRRILSCNCLFCSSRRVLFSLTSFKGCCTSRCSFRLYMAKSNSARCSEGEMEEAERGGGGGVEGRWGCCCFCWRITRSVSWSCWIYSCCCFLACSALARRDINVRNCCCCCCWARCTSCTCCFRNAAWAASASLISCSLLANRFIGRATSFTVLAVAAFSAEIASMLSCCIVFC